MYRYQKRENIVIDDAQAFQATPNSRNTPLRDGTRAKSQAGRIPNIMMAHTSNYLETAAAMTPGMTPNKRSQPFVANYVSSANGMQR